MKKIIKYYYDLVPEKVFHQKNIHKFIIEKTKYMLYEVNNESEELEEKYKIQEYLNKINVCCNLIIKNKMGLIITQYNEKKFILIEQKIETRRINIMDILLLTSINIDNIGIKTIYRTDWKKMWEKKIDYIEHQIISNTDTKEIIKESIYYYIGLTENCISILQEPLEKKDKYKAICHERIGYKMTTDEFYNPINFIIDKRIRNFAEYIRGQLYNTPDKIENIKKILDELLTKIRLNREELILLYARIVYPGEYFDIYEKIIMNLTNEKELLKIINNSSKIEKNIKIIYEILNKNKNIQPIEWLNKN